MNNETGKTEQINNEGQAEELTDKALDGVAGGKSYFESHSNIANQTPTALPTKAPPTLAS